MQFNHIDVKAKKAIKPHVSQFVIKRMVDEHSDLSHLTEHLAGEEYTEQDNEQLRRYEAGDWYMMGIKTEAVFLLDSGCVGGKGGRSAIIQTLYSGGLWGIESNSGEDYIKTVENEEIDSLKRYCKELGIKFSRNTPIVHAD